MKKIYIQAASSITVQDTFAKSGFSEALMHTELESTDLIQPIYKEYINPALLRRTPKINKMALACTEDCVRQYTSDPWDAIIVGTGLGCLKDTEKFLETVLKTSDGIMLPPTAFIQSGHNAIGGQIALIRGNHNYNMTHVQWGLSFEHSLLDAMLTLREGKDQVLVGATDERIDLLNELAVKFGLEEKLISSLTEGSSFFILNAEQQSAKVSVTDLRISSPDWRSDLQEMLSNHDMTVVDLGHVFYGNNLGATQDLNLDVSSTEYTKVCGRYFSSSGFGFHLASDYLMHSDSNCALVVNFAGKNQVGLTLLHCD